MDAAYFSTWNGVDLHIHSNKSNDVKPNDYVGTKFTALQYIEKLLEKGISIFSITDHNCIDIDLYKNIYSELDKDIFKNRINVIVGVELDVKDSTIYKDSFHCLLFFETSDYRLAKNVIDSIFDNRIEAERNDENNYPEVSKIFRKCHEKGIQNIILIPHYRDKHKGIDYKRADADKYLFYLNCLCFNAYEDSNNTVNLQRSLKCYLDHGCEFPFVAFSDNHDLSNYPKGKNGVSGTKCSMLSNVKFPFNSIKTAFEEPYLRISLDGVSGLRSTGQSNKYIESFIENGKEYKLSPYSNTIIGRFGSGKSLLFKRLIDGNKSLENDEKYGDLFDPFASFQIKINGSCYDSVRNCSDIQWYMLTQKEEYSYKSSFELDPIKKLFGQLNINKYHFPTSDKTFSFNRDDFLGSFNTLCSQLSSSEIVNNLNYEKAFLNIEYFDVNTEDKIDTKAVTAKIQQYDSLDEIIDLQLDGISLFSETAMDGIRKVAESIKRVSQIITFFDNCDFHDFMCSTIQRYRDNYISNDEKTKTSKIKMSFEKLSESIINFKNEAEKFSSVFDENEYLKLCENDVQSLISDYSISSKYVEVGEKYPSPISSFSKDADQKSTLFQTIINIEADQNRRFKNNLSFEQCMDKYILKINSMFTRSRLRYDILKGNESLLKKSSGEKASLFMDFLFDLMKNDIDEGKSIVLFLDQPENDIDNKNICDSITNRIRAIKRNSKNFQSFVITHNGNVGIGSDSESIIIAKDKFVDEEKTKKGFYYEFGCIENATFIKNACNILEGGEDAMIKRTTKYGINVIKKVKEHGN